MTMAVCLLWSWCSLSSAFVAPRSGIVNSVFCRNHGPLFMSSAEEEAKRLREQAAKLREEVASLSVKDEVVQEEEKTAVAAAPAGTFYDDEVEPVRVDPLSGSMKERLRREASTGMDSEKGQTNVILYISVAVAILVALGGSGILY